MGQPGGGSQMAGKAMGIWKGLIERTEGGQPKDLQQGLEEEITCVMLVDTLRAISDTHKNRYWHVFF